MITPALKKNLYEEISTQIMDMIERGSWKETERIPGELELARMFEVSRNSLRESIKALSLIGLLKAKSGSGTYVAEHAVSIIHRIKQKTYFEDDSSLIDIMEARIIIEPGLTRMAVERSKPDDIAKLREALRLENEALKRQDYDFVPGFNFHSTLFRLSGNKVLIDIFEAIKEQLIAVRREIFIKVADESIMRREGAEHETIIDLIESKQADAAEELMRKHLKDSLERLKNRQK